MRALIRVDSSAALGMGHAMRCLALAQQLRDRGTTVEFAGCDLPGSMLGEIESVHGFPVHRLRTTGESPPGGDLDWIVIDHYGLDAAWEKRARERCRVLAIDDLADRDHACDLLLDQNFHPDPQGRYRGRVPTACRLLLGPRYALLRASFAAARATAAPRRSGLRRALVAYGGSDAGGETVKALQGLRLAALRDLAAVDVIVGPGNPRADEIRALCAQIPGARICSRDEDMASLMAAADVALGAGGITMWERCALGLPSVLTAIAANQVPSSAAMGEAGVCLYLGAASDATPQTIADALRGLAASPALARHLGAAGARLVDGLGARRVADAMLGTAVALRRAGAADCERIFQWRNHPDVRGASFDPARLDPARHREWFAAALVNPARDLLVIELAGRPVGALRYDIEGAVARVSVFLDPATAGRGVGSSALRLGADWLRANRAGVQRIDAEVLARNGASLQAFANAGFLEARKTLERTLSHDA